MYTLGYQIAPSPMSIRHVHDRSVPDPILTMRLLSEDKKNKTDKPC
jgi:hypothetical protein